MNLTALNKFSNIIKLPFHQYNNGMRIIALTVIYAAAANIGLLFATTEGNITMIWPPSGIALAALIIFGKKLWPGILFGAFIADMLVSGNITASFGMAFAATASALFGFWLINRLIGKENFLSKVTHLYKFFFVAFVSPVIAANIGSLSLMLTGLISVDSYITVSWTWWLGDVAGIIIFAPLIVAWKKDIQPPFPYKPNYLEISLFTLLLILVSSLPLISSLPTQLVGYPIAFIAFPFCIWAAYRYCMKQVTLTIIIIMILAVYTTITGHGPFYRETLSESLFQLQVFMLITVITTLSLASAVFERQRFESQLIKQRKRAEELTLAKSQFMSNMSHELRTPLNAIIGFSHILEKDKSSLNQQHHEFVGHISRAGNHLLCLVNDLLDIEQSNAHKLNIQLSRFKLSDAISESINFVTQMAKEKNISIHYKKDTEQEMLVFADKIRLRQVLINLISNAAKYNHDGGDITVNCDKPDASHVRIAITDTGDGIEEQDLKKIFEPFTRAQIEGSDIEGSGMGLTVTYKLVELMNGSISVKSEIAKGSTFTIILPA